MVYTVVSSGRLILSQYNLEECRALCNALFIPMDIHMNRRVTDLVVFFFD